MISFILATRKRPKMAILSIESILNNIDNWDEIEILFGIDNDDAESQTEIKLYLTHKNFRNYHIINMERPFYDGCFLYHNELVKISTMPWIILWNDDIKLQSKNPNQILKKYNNGNFLINPSILIMTEYPSKNETERNLHFNDYISYGKNTIPMGDHNTACIPFAFYNKRWIDILGHVSLNSASDTWMEYIGRKLNMVVYEPEIMIRNCNDVNHLNKLLSEYPDDVYINRQSWRDNGGPTKFWESCHQMNADVKTLNTSFFITNEVMKIYKDVRGGFFVDINEEKETYSPLKFLENEWWNGVCISNNPYYCSNRKCYIEPYTFERDKLYNRNVYGYSYFLEKIATHDQSNLMHVMYINCKNSIEVAISIIKESYSRAFDEEPTMGHWANQVLLLIVDTNGDEYKELKDTCEKYFIYFYKQMDNIVFFKHEILHYES